MQGEWVRLCRAPPLSRIVQVLISLSLSRFRILRLERLVAGLLVRKRAFALHFLCRLRLHPVG